MVLCLCGCGEETNIFRGISRKYLLGHNTKSIIRTKQYCKNLSTNRMGKNNPMYGKIPWNKDKKFPQYSGENNPHWRGGKKLSTSRQHAKHHELGNTFLNNPNIGLVGHHINMDYIVYVPKEINSISHNVRSGRNMGIVNYMTLLWLITSGEINNIKEI